MCTGRLGLIWQVGGAAHLPFVWHHHDVRGPIFACMVCEIKPRVQRHNTQGTHDLMIVRSCKALWRPIHSTLQALSVNCTAHCRLQQSEVQKKPLAHIHVNIILGCFSGFLTLWFHVFPMHSKNKKTNKKSCSNPLRAFQWCSKEEDE